MGGLSTWFGWSTDASSNEDLPSIFPLDYARSDFVRLDVVSIYTKILTDVLERTQGLKENQMPLLWDSCLKSESSKGLITLLAEAMYDKKDLFLVYDRSVNIIRIATQDEQLQIEEDYKKKAESKTGVYVSFKKFEKNDMIKLYSALEYCTIAALNKNLNLSSSLQIKIHDLRKSVGLNDVAVAKAQAKQIAEALADGKDTYMDAEDEVLSAMPDLTAVKESIQFIDNKRSFYLGVPASYINGEQTSGIGSTGEADTKAVERGLKAYYFSIIKPVLFAVFGVKTSYKSQDFRQITQALEALKTFQLTDEAFISEENKTLIVNKLFDLPEDSEGEGVSEETEPALPPGQNALPPGQKVAAPPQKPEPKA